MYFAAHNSCVQIEKVLQQINEAAKKKKEEISNMEAKYEYLRKLQKEAESKEEEKKEEKAGGVLV